MKQNQNNIDCTPSKDEEGVTKYLIQMCKDTDSVVTFHMVCEGDYEVKITARKKGTRSSNEFSVEQFETIKAMAEEKLAQVDDKKLFQDIIYVCNGNIADAKAQEEGCSENEEN
ncbi:hypothetical protein [Segatella copri]|jgi:hypothetical protein|uniref:hypothetical protein n=1 Tax=Segatella copri TaxID=165179 RepID=UPI001C440C34|nr:hypothetical protein [Segatella copri]MBW0026056.1 hypothetical protein [Segatella copri]